MPFPVTGTALAGIEEFVITTGAAPAAPTVGYTSLFWWMGGVPLITSGPSFLAACIAPDRLAARPISDRLAAALAPDRLAAKQVPDRLGAGLAADRLAGRPLIP